MARPRIILADTDVDYIFPIQLKFIEEFFEKIDLEVITERDFFDQLFSAPQRAAVLIVSEGLYSVSLQKHNIQKVFLMTEDKEEDGTDDLNIEKVFKYSNIKGVFNEIVGKSGTAINIENVGKKEPQIVVVTSAAGGVGKTTVAMGLAACLSQDYKKVLYINCGQLQCFGHLLKNGSVISNNKIYSKITRTGFPVYSEIQHIIRQESFSYLPPFKASLVSLGISSDIFNQIAIQARKKGDYDFVIVDTDSVFDEVKAEILTVADKVVVVTKQNRTAVIATNTMVKNVNGLSNDKFIFICNDFDTKNTNALISPEVDLKFTVNEYIEHIPHYDTFLGMEFANQPSIKKATFLFD